MARNPSAVPQFSSIMEEAPTEVIRPKPLPEGTYLCVVKEYERGASAKKNTPYTRFILEVVSAMDDVDQEALAAAGGIEKKTLRVDFWETADAIYRLDEFHEACGIDLSVAMARKHRNDECVNAQILAYAEQEIDEDDPERIYVNVTSTAAVE